MNTHPLLVHFTIAPLTSYAICELIRFKNTTPKHYWFHIKTILIIAGLVTSELALGRGETMEHTLREDNLIKNVIAPMHAASAEGAIGIFLILAMSYLVLRIEYDSSKKFLMKYSVIAKQWGRLIKIAKWNIGSPTSLVFALISIVGVTITEPHVQQLYSTRTKN